MTRRSSPEPTVSQRIGDFIAGTTAKNISAEVLETAKLHLLDGLATMLSGVNQPSAQLLRRHYLEIDRQSEASVIGSRSKISAQHAALLNGVAAHVLDYDDAQMTTLASRPMGQQTHPTSPVLAAVLGLAESTRANGAALLTSYIVGVEVACRLGDAVDPSHYLDGFHPTGTLGVFGAAAACAHLLRLKPVAIRHALGIAGTLSSGLRANRGAMAKGLNAGRAAENGLLAAQLAVKGFTASENIFDDPMGFFSAACKNKLDRQLLRFGAPLFFAKPGVGIKLYPCVGVLHPAIDLLLLLRRRYRLIPERIEKISITLDADAALPLVYPKPKDALQAKFSVEFAAAVAIADGAAGLKQFSPERVGDAKIRTLMKRVQLIRRPAAKRSKKAGIDTQVEIASKSGAIYGARDRIARGHPARPAARADIEEKFRQCADGVLPPHAIEKFLKSFDSLQQSSSVAAWLAPLHPARR
ncbi:MAG: MmgE/PrpD family protein [Deltaproteobacteria bacterium]|nr:MmgE/PrpD family protein [Deltaproteobacteria bacterium]